MISATAVPSTILRFAGNLPYVNIDLSRFQPKARGEDVALEDAYRQFATSYGNAIPAGFDRSFLTRGGAEIIRAFADGRMERHDAAEALAVAWDSQLDPVRSAERRERILDTTMAADSLLRFYDATRKGESLHAPAAAAPTDFALLVTLDATEQDAAGLAAVGVLDRSSYLNLLEEAHLLYRQGIRHLTLDLSEVSHIELSGIYALHAVAKIYRGESYHRHEYGFAGLRHMVEENIAAGVHTHVRLTAANERIMHKLEQAKVAEIFGM